MQINYSNETGQMSFIIYKWGLLCTQRYIILIPIPLIAK